MDKMDNINKSDKMDKPDKPDKVNKLKKMDDGISKMKLMDFCNEKRMHKSVIIALVVLLMTIFVQDEDKWNSLNQLIKILFPGMPILPKPVYNPVIEQFTSSTTDLFRDISLAEIPAPGEITRYVDSYSTLAIMLERSEAHKNTGKIAAGYLNDYSELLYKAGDALREMFVESKTVHNTFEIEVKSMIEKFTGTKIRIFMNPDFFKLRILKLEKAIMEFRTIVDNVMRLIIEVQQKTKVVSQSLIDAQVEAGDYNIHNTGKKNFDLAAEAINGVKDMRRHLDETAAGLTEVRGKLKNYELSMVKVKANLGAAGCELTKESLQHLKAAVDFWRKCQTKFLKKQEKRVD